MAEATSETGSEVEQRGPRKQDAQCSLEKKSRKTTDVPSLLARKPSHGVPFSLSHQLIYSRNWTAYSLLTMPWTSDLPFWTIPFLSLTEPGP
jgi:hypothetical protein